MNKLIVFFAALFAALSVVAEMNDADFLRLLYRRYTNEVSKAGTARNQWHGKVERSIILTNELRRVDIHADGAIFTNLWYDASAQKLKVNNKRNFKTPPMTNGIPVKLAEARMRRWCERQAVSNVTITVEAGGLSRGSSKAGGQSTR